jgi:hypothetical protein
MTLEGNIFMRCLAVKKDSSWSFFFQKIGIEHHVYIIGSSSKVFSGIDAFARRARCDDAYIQRSTDLFC